MRSSGQDKPESMRITDNCGHFLGKVEAGRLYIYCRRCKRTIPITIDEKELSGLKPELIKEEDLLLSIDLER